MYVIEHAVPDVDEDMPIPFAELSDEAKEIARENFREHHLDYDWWEFCFEDFATIAELLGITLKQRQVKIMNGRSYTEPEIYFSGFWNQGDGACFEGRWSPEMDPMSILDGILAHAPCDDRLHEIALSFADLCERHGTDPDEDGRTVVKLTHTDRYCHEYAVSIDFETELPECADDWNEFQLMTWEATRRARNMDTWEEDVKGAMRDLMRWLYRQLEQEYEHLNSDFCVDEALADREFLPDGTEA